MSARKTIVSEKAWEIFYDIQPLLESGVCFLKEYKIGENVYKVQTRLRGIMSERKMTMRIWIAVCDGSLYVRNRDNSEESPREQELTKMIRTLAMHVDNDVLYEQALALVGTI